MSTLLCLLPVFLPMPPPHISHTSLTSPPFVSRPRCSMSLASRVSQVVGFGDVDPRSLEVMGELGSGSFGTVCKARWRSTYVAVKKLHRALRNKDLAEDDVRVKELRDEIQIMREMRHPNVILIMAFCEDPPLIVMEYMPLGSLFEYFHQESGSKLPWALGLRMIMDITRGLAFLHAHNPPVVHRDMKSPNCLITSDWRCKVADFGISKLIEPTKVPKASAGINVFSSYVPARGFPTLLSPCYLRV